MSDASMSNMIFHVWKLYGETDPFESSIQSWRNVVQKCEENLAATDDPDVIAFNESILRLARLELEAAVVKRMSQ